MYHDLSFDQKVRKISEFSFKITILTYFLNMCIMHGHVCMILYAILIKLLLNR